MRLLRDLITLQEEPIVILAAMGSQLRRLYAARVLMDSGDGVRGLQELYQLSSYAANRSLKTARQLPLAWCARAVTLCAEADYRLKTSFDDPARLMELLLLRLLAEDAA